MKNTGVKRTNDRANLFRSSVALLALSILSACNSSNVREERIPDISGVWTNALLSPEDTRWRIEDLACARTGCSLAGFKYLQSLLLDPNENRSVKELFYHMRGYEKEINKTLLTQSAQQKAAQYRPEQGAALDCTPEGDSLRHQITAPVPMEIQQFDDKVIMRYEYWNAVRTIYMDVDTAPDAALTRLGVSTGRYEGATFIVETTRVISNIIGVPGGGALAPSEDTRFVERYTLNPDSGRLDLELAIIDPVNFRKPYENQRSYLPAPDWELDEFICEAITGEY
ncbi:MAG: hypothetical protein ACJAUG_002644 [Halioglobus sp.]|jgi:hypothetical protein